MKKPILTSLLGLFLLAGCGQKILPAPNPTQTTEIWTQWFLVDTWIYPYPIITTSIWTGLLVKWLNGDDTPGKTYERIKNISEYNEEYYTTIVTGYLYTYTYQDLWIKITTPPLYEPYFSTKTDSPIFTRYKNIIYNTQSSIIWWDYMEVFFKNPETSFEDEIRKKHLSLECDILTGTLDYTDGLFASMQWFLVIYITALDGNLASNWEIFDKQFPENTFSIAFVMDPSHPEKYYKFSYGDCAPGPCSVFDSIEFF